MQMPQLRAILCVLLACIILIPPATSSQQPSPFIDLLNASVLVTASTPRAASFVALLRREACSRLQRPLARCWPVVNSSTGSPLIVLALAASDPPEGYDLHTVNSTVTVAGYDERGLLYGIGRLLREIAFSCVRSFAAVPERSARLPAAIAISSSPAFSLRGHQLGFRPKTNSYDAWSTEQMAQYIGELAIFGANNIELLPPHTDDDAESPLFTVEPFEMLGAASRAADDLGLNVSLWYPAMFINYSDPSVMAAGALAGLLGLGVGDVCVHLLLGSTHIVIPSCAPHVTLCLICSRRGMARRVFGDASCGRHLHPRRRPR